jgi:parallel beta-helix repeat protein
LFGASNVTVNGLQLKNFAKTSLHAGWDTLGTSTPNITFIDNIAHDNYVDSTGLIAAFGNVPNATIDNNYVYNAAGQGIVLQAAGGTAVPGGMTGGRIRNNFIYNTGTTELDAGAIYLRDFAGGTNPAQRSTNILVQNNFIRDATASNDAGGRGIYLDDGTSNVTVSGNVITGRKWVGFQVHGGQNNVFTGNIIDLQSSGKQAIGLYQSPPNSAWIIPMTRNTFTNNIVIAASASASASASAGYIGYEPNAPATIANNIYWNYESPNTNIKTTGSGGAGSDTNPVFEDPQISTLHYTVAQGSPVYDAPVSFPGIVGSWGPDGFTIPYVRTAPRIHTNPPP